jgi:hypothetical protein
MLIVSLGAATLTEIAFDAATLSVIETGDVPAEILTGGLCDV